MEPLRVPPHSIEAEQSVIGSMIIDNQCIDDVLTRISSVFFYNRTNGIIFKAIDTMYRNKVPVDRITLVEHLDKSNPGEMNFTYISDLANTTPSSCNISAYVDIVVSDYLAREAIARMCEGLDTLYRGQRDTRLSEAIGSITGIKLDNKKGGVSGPEEICQSYLDEAERVVKMGTGLSGMSTGYKWLDHYTGGFSRGDYICIAARSGAGKTTYALNIVKHYILNKRNVLIDSLEMKKFKLMQKIVSDMCNIPLNKIRSSDLDDYEWAKISECMKFVKDSGLNIDDSGGLTIIDIESRARKVKAKLGTLDLIVVDYIQKIRVGTANRYSEITDASGRLKDLAMELDSTVMVLSQLRKNSIKRPTAADLRETGAIENDADVIVFLHTDSPSLKPQPSIMTAEIFDKVRLGESGAVHMLENQLKFQRFVSTDYKDSFKEEPGSYTEKFKKW